MYSTFVLLYLHVHVLVLIILINFVLCDFRAIEGNPIIFLKKEEEEKEEEEVKEEVEVEMPPFPCKLKLYF